jgi:hypothetical protein
MKSPPLLEVGVEARATPPLIAAPRMAVERRQRQLLPTAPTHSGSVCSAGGSAAGFGAAREPGVDGGVTSRTQTLIDGGETASSLAIRRMDHPRARSLRALRRSISFLRIRTDVRMRVGRNSACCSTPGQRLRRRSVSQPQVRDFLPGCRGLAVVTLGPFLLRRPPRFPSREGRSERPDEPDRSSQSSEPVYEAPAFGTRRHLFTELPNDVRSIERAAPSALEGAQRGALGSPRRSTSWWSP